jgi:hypothetical protein
LASDSPAVRKAMAKIGGHALRATHDPAEYTAASHEAFLERFLVEADPNTVLEPEERQRRAQALRQAYMARLGLAGAKARWRRQQLEQARKEAAREHVAALRAEADTVEAELAHGDGQIHREDHHGVAEVEDEE